NDKHLAKASKDRTGLFMDKPEFIINKATGRKLIQYCNEGVSKEQALIEIKDCVTIDDLKHIYEKYSSIQSEIKPDVMARKTEIETINQQLVDEKTIVQPL